MVRISQHFTEDEMKCPSTGDFKLADGFLERLEELRGVYGPMRITSGARSDAHNKRIGGHPRSLHVYDNSFHNTKGCCAVDVHVLNRTQKGNLVADAWNLGFSVGVGFNFVHVDDRTRILGLPQTLYTY
jgi:uncharacterized protein YcbK (DUF882 family)